MIIDELHSDMLNELDIELRESRGAIIFEQRQFEAVQVKDEELRVAQETIQLRDAEVKVLKERLSVAEAALAAAVASGSSDGVQCSNGYVRADGGESKGQLHVVDRLGSEGAHCCSRDVAVQV